MGAESMTSPSPPIGHVKAPSTPYHSTRDDPRYSIRMLFTRWRGSVYKLVWKNLVVWLCLYYMLMLWYRYGMTTELKKKFEFVCRFCDKYNDLIPITFVLGFYVNLIIHRWWTMWDLLPWPDNAAFFISCAFPGQDEKSRMTRRTVVRYLNLASVHAKCLLSPRVRKRFPTMDHFVDAGLMTENERRIVEGLMKKGQKLFYIPLLWASVLVTRARNDKRMSDWDWQQCIQAIVDYRTRLSRSLHIELVNIPLVYSQVVALSVYTFSLSCLLGRQFIQVDKYAVEMYLPVFTVLQLVFYWGWLKVAESMIDPYGEDDADFDLNYYIDKNVKMSYMIVDAAMGAEFPDPVKDPYWEQQVPSDLPYTDESKADEARRRHPHADGNFDDILPNAESLVQQLEASLSTRRRATMLLRRRHSSVKDLMNRLHPALSKTLSSTVGNSNSRTQLYGIAEEGGVIEDDGARKKSMVTRVASAPPQTPPESSDMPTLLTLTEITEPATTGPNGVQSGSARTVEIPVTVTERGGLQPVQGGEIRTIDVVVAPPEEGGGVQHHIETTSVSASALEDIFGLSVGQLQQPQPFRAEQGVDDSTQLASKSPKGGGSTPSVGV